MAAPVTSEARVPVADLQQVTGPDLAAIGALGQGSLDNVVLNCIAAGVGYTGMAATVGTSATAVVVAPGWLLKGGPAFALRDAYSLDLSSAIAAVPDASKTAIVLVLADGQEFDSSEVRTFLDASKKPTNASDPWPTVTFATPTRRVRSVVVSKVAGAADVQPQAPAYSAILCLIATVVVSNTGIVSVTQNTAQQITRLDQLAPLVAAQGAALKAAQVLINGLLSSVSGLATLYSRLANDEAQLTALGQRISALETRTVTASTPGTVLTVTDTYTDTSGLTVGDGTGYGVGSGLTFPTASKTPVGGFAPLNPADPNIAIIAGRYLTAPYTTGEVRYSNSLAPGGMNVYETRNSGSWNAVLQKSGFGVARTRYGASYQAQGTTQLLASGDPTRLFAVNAGDLVYDPSWADWKSTSPELNHLNGLWKDNTGRGYWTPKSADGAVSNTPTVTQVIRTPYDEMSMGLRVICTNGVPGARLIVCEDLNGLPNPAAVLADCTSTANQYGHLIWTFTAPVLRRAGQDHHYVIVSAQSLRLLLEGDPKQPQSCRQFMYLDSFGNWIQHQASLYCYGQVMTFSYPGPVEISGLMLAGGIGTIDVLTPALLPNGGDINYGLIFTGQTAYNRLKSYDPAFPGTNLLAGNPSQFRFFLELSGTPGTAPVIDLGASSSGTVQSMAARRAAALTAESVVRTPTAPVTKVTRAVTIVGFNPALHTYAEAVETGAGYATVTAPTTAGAPVAQADGTTLLTFAWTLGAAVPSFKVKITGATTDATQSYRVTQSITTASP